MGGNTSKVTITAQDKSILESVQRQHCAQGALTARVHSLKLQRDRLRQYQRRVRRAINASTGSV